MQIQPDILKQCWFLAGPTACGKTTTSLRLAERLDAEILALDSMSLYRGMDIGTAKATVGERQRVRHHLIDLIHPNEDFSVADYVEAANAACLEIIDRGKAPLFVGGTGLYLRAILRGVFEGPAADWDFRNSLADRAEQHGPNWLHEQVASVDPKAASQLHPNDHRRLIRALEVLHVTGSPMSEQHQQVPLPDSLRPQNVFWLSPPRDWLYERINRRVDMMIEDGLVDEVKSLLSSDHPPARTARQALGYAEVIGFLEGSGTLAEAIETIKTRTRQFAKRQHTWFRNLVECKAIELRGDESPEDVVSMLMGDSGS
ncbi:MAG: tRNA (adenosine(37)-N6)-dimethylallyltransferase MiaA [Planctomycetaceae bacterium]